MSHFVRKLRERKLVRWALAYVAAAWVVIEVVGQLGDIFAIPVALQRGLVVMLAFGLIVTVVLAWYHGERGRQRVSGPELAILAVTLGLGAVTLSTIDLDEDRGPVASPPAGPNPPVRSVAVLPFTDLSPEQDQAYFSDGIAEELRSALARVEGLRVASSTSSLSVEDRRLPPAEIGQRLGVSYLVEGSVRKNAERLRVEARLVNVADGFHEWSAAFDGENADVFAVQDSIGRAVAHAFEVGFANSYPSVQPPGQTADHVAQDLYLRGRFAWNRRTRDGLEAAVDYFLRALERDPRYARALVGLADAYAVLGFYDFRPPSEAFPLAQEAARRALALEPSLAEPHATLGYAALYHDWDWTAAEESFRTAIRLDPGYPVAHQWYANHLTAMGRFDQALSEMRSASELDPLSMIAFAATGWVHLYSGDHQAAIQQLEAAIERDPDFEPAYLWMGQAHEAIGDFDTAEELLRTAVALSGASAISRAALARTLGLSGRAPEARAILDQLEREGRAGYVPSYEVARAWAGLGDFEAALTWLTKAVDERAHSVAFLAVDPQLDPLRPLPRFQAILERVDLQERR